MIQTETNKLYTGITTDLERRLSEHQTGIKGAKFFRFSKVLHIVYQELCSNRSEASIREAKLKKLTRLEKLALITNTKQCCRQLK